MVQRGLAGKLLLGCGCGRLLVGLPLSCQAVREDARQVVQRDVCWSLAAPVEQVCEQLVLCWTCGAGQQGKTRVEVRNALEGAGHNRARCSREHAWGLAWVLNGAVTCEKVAGLAMRARWGPNKPRRTHLAAVMLGGATPGRTESGWTCVPCTYEVQKR